MTDVRTMLFRDPAQLAEHLPQLTVDASALLLLSLGFEPARYLRIAERVDGDAALFLADCYGIVGFSSAEQRNIEILEQGRGAEYGGVGGDGGRGVVAVAFCGDAVATIDELPERGVDLHLVIAADGDDVERFVEQHASAIYSGGVAKATYRYTPVARRWLKVPRLALSLLRRPGRATGTTSFTDEPREALRRLLDDSPAGTSVRTVGLFPCFMRGKNVYQANHVEPDAVSGLLPGVPVYGMFCHGELGPRQCLGFGASGDPRRLCATHSMTTIVVMHAATSN